MYPNVRTDYDESAAKPELRDVIERLAHTSRKACRRSARTATMGQNPKCAVELVARYWDMLHRGGTVPHEIKELARIHRSRRSSAANSARARFLRQSPSITEEEKRKLRAAELGSIPDPKTRVPALHYARTLTLDDTAGTRKCTKSFKQFL